MDDDLISRKALKKEFDVKCAYECAICKYSEDFAPCKLIDNAPTIEQECYITGEQWDEFMKEHKKSANIIYCKDCEFCEKSDSWRWCESMGLSYWICTKGRGVGIAERVNLNDFCSSAKLREEKKNE